MGAPDTVPAGKPANRDLNLERVRMQCGEVKAIIEEDKHNGRMRVVKIIEDKYGKY